MRCAYCAWVALSVMLTGVCDGVDLASPLIKHNLNICQGTIDDAVGLFQNITNATLKMLIQYDLPTKKTPNNIHECSA